MRSIYFKFLPVFFITLLLSVSSGASLEITPVSLEKILVPESDFHFYLESTRGEKLRAFPLSELKSLISQDFKWRKEQVTRKQLDDEKLPYDWAILNSSFKGQQNGLELTFHGEFVIETTLPGMHIVPILGDGVSLKNATINGEYARLAPTSATVTNKEAPFCVIINQVKPGVLKHLVNVDFLAPIKPVDYYHKTSFTIIPAPVSNMNIVIEGTNLDVSIPSGLGIKQVEAENKTNISAYLKPAAQVEITWFKLSRNSQTSKDLKDKILSDKNDIDSTLSEENKKDTASPVIQEKPLWLESTIFQEIEIGEGRVDGTVRVSLNSYRKPLSKIRIKTLNETKLLNLSLLNIGNTIDKWDSNEEDGTIDIEFRHPQEGNTSLLFIYHSDTGGKSTFKTTIPEFIVEGSKRQNGYIAIRRRTIVEIAIDKKSKTLDEIPLSSVPSEYVNDGVKKSLLIYRYLTHPFNLELSIKRYGDAPVLTTVIDNVEASTIISDNGNCFTKTVYTIRSRTKAPLEFNVATMGAAAAIEEVLLNNEETALSHKSDGTLEVSLATAKSLSADDEILLELWCSHKLNELRFTGSNSISLPTVNAEVKKVNWSLAIPKRYRCFGFFGNYGKISSFTVPVPIASADHHIRSKYIQYSIERALLPAKTSLVINYSYIKTSVLNVPVLIFFLLGVFSAHAIFLILTREENNSPWLSALVTIIILSILFSRQISNFLPWLFVGLLFYGLLLIFYITYRAGVMLRQWWKNRKTQNYKRDLNAVQTNIARVHGEVEGGDDSE